MPENNFIKSDELKKIAHGQAVVEARQALDNDCRVLSVSATASVRPSEIFAGEARYAGKVRFDCLILNDGKVECMQVIAEFSDKIVSPDITVGMNVRLVPDVINCEANADGSSVKLVAVVDTRAFAAVRSESVCVTEPDDGIYIEKCAIDYCTVVAEQTETAYITDSLPDVKVVEILCATSRAVVTSAESAENAVKVSGAVYTAVIARTSDDLVASYKIVTPYVKSVSAQGAFDGNIAYATAAVTDSVATLVTDGDESRIDLSVTLMLDVTAVNGAQTEAACDVFCACNEIETVTTDVIACAVEPQTTIVDTVDGQITLGSDRLAADNVLCVTNTFCTLSSVDTENGRVSVEGLTGGDIVYYNAEKNAVDAIAFRLPFSMPLGLHTDAQSVTASATVTDVSVRVRRESVFDIKVEIAFTLGLSTCRTVTLVESVKRGAEIPRPDATVIVHIAKPGETLWQAAKALCCSPERVIEQNDATSPFAGGERLINFCGK